MRAYERPVPHWFGDPSDATLSIRATTIPKTVHMGFSTFLDRGLVPDFLIRFGIRRLLKDRIRLESEGALEGQQRRHMDWVRALRDSRIAIETDAANEQHYEVPAALYEKALGPHLKYSSGLWRDGITSLGDAERAMLECYGERARLADGQRVLDLGCGWGSFSLWAAAQFPNSRFTAVSNSASQKEFIDGRARAAGLTNLEVITCDVNKLELDEEFDRIVTVEMFEHVRNYRALLERVSKMLRDDGLLFVHIFTHREFAYPFETEGEDNWMGRYFFTGGQMPSDQLLLYFQDHVAIEDHWRVNGVHYSKTAEAWLSNFDREIETLRPVLRETYGAEANKMEIYWRVFFMACSELWKWNNGTDWFVSHYLFKKRVPARVESKQHDQSRDVAPMST